jgi:hypothetical protein
VRLLILDTLTNDEKRILAYHKNGKVYVFAWDENHKRSLGLAETLLQVADQKGSQKSLFWGVTDTKAAVRKLLRDSDCIMISDPQVKDSSIVDELANDANLVVYASHGQALIQRMESKLPVLSSVNKFVLPG